MNIAFIVRCRLVVALHSGALRCQYEGNWAVMGGSARVQEAHAINLVTFALICVSHLAIDFEKITPVGLSPLSYYRLWV